VIGDVLHIKQEYFSTSASILQWAKKQGVFNRKKAVIAIGGESGSGKSVTAVCLQEVMAREGIRAGILHQDDYFYLPPKTNHAKREENISCVGVQEVNVELLQLHINSFKKGFGTLEKPLMHYPENKVVQETVDMATWDTLIVEGTYAMMLENVDLAIFMERTFRDTLENRKKRAREAFTPFIERVLEIEHHLISATAKRADLLVQKDYSVKSTRE
jgi:uridine kinase